MPYQPILPTWVAINNANFTSQSGLTDPITGQPVNAGGLNVGDYFDLTDQEASSASYTTNGILYAGRYRLVHVDSSATAANVKTGTVGFLRNGSTVKSAVILTPGSGQTAGTYQIPANTGVGGGVGAILGVVVGAGGTVTNVYVVAGGFGYSSLPTFTVAAGGTPGTVAAQLDANANLVTSADQAGSTAVGGANNGVRPVVFLNPITPGNYGFAQELGVATVLGNATQTSAAVGSYANAVPANNGTVTTTVSSGSPIGSTIGVAIDLPVVSNLFKIQLQYVPVVQG